MNAKNVNLLISEALAAKDMEMYVAEWSTSSIFPESSVLTENAGYLEQLWNVAHMSVGDIVKASGMKRTEFADRFMLPYRTVTNWCNGERSCPDYTRLMMAEILGLLKR